MSVKSWLFNSPEGVITQIKWYARAVLDCPRGVLCGWCWRLNFFFDDCGFFAIKPHGTDFKVCCKRCWRGPLGDAHIARYGIGER